MHSSMYSQAQLHGFVSINKTSIVESARVSHPVVRGAATFVCAAGLAASAWPGIPNKPTLIQVVRAVGCLGLGRWCLYQWVSAEIIVIKISVIRVFR